MRYLSLFVIVALMWLTWSRSQNSAGLSETTHIGIQEDLKRLISEFVSEKIPSSSDLTFTKFWTEDLGQNKVKASFSYRFNEMREFPAEDGKPTRAPESVIVEVSGSATLSNKPATSANDAQYDIWQIESIDVDDNKVIYKDGMTIKANE